MRLFSKNKAQAFDRLAQEKFKVPSIILMENAGRSVAEIALTMGTSFLIVCGKGNNGGDGLVAARHLINHGRKVKILLLGEPQGDAKINYEILKKMKACFVKKFSEADVVIDAVFGIGLSSEVKDPYKSTIKKINSLGKPVLSVDVPSGLDATTGKILGTAVSATKTVTFVAPKTGFYKNDGPKVCGEIIVRDIGIIL